MTTIWHEAWEEVNEMRHCVQNPLVEFVGTTCDDGQGLRPLFKRVKYIHGIRKAYQWLSAVAIKWNLHVQWQHLSEYPVLEDK